MSFPQKNTRVFLLFYTFPDILLVLLLVNIYGRGVFGREH